MHTEEVAAPLDGCPDTDGAAPLLSLRGITVSFKSSDGLVRAVRGVDLALGRGAKLGLVGESGSGKSQLFRGILGLSARSSMVDGRALFDGEDMLRMAPRARRRLLGRRIGLIFQNPMSSLNPYLRISTQLTETVIHHEGCTRAEATKRALKMMDLVQIPDARGRFHRYPHEFSGGMRQRVMIAGALLCRPDLLIADEPTTALDVTIQAQIVRLLDEINRELGTAIVFITHNLGVIAEFAETLAVMYAGRIVEQGRTADVFRSPGHPYTVALMRSAPTLDDDIDVELANIPGNPPDLRRTIGGCAFAERCTLVQEPCRQAFPPALGLEPGHYSCCLRVSALPGHCTG